jgi:tRNA (guanosine-2'-O-)-methyltransferase
MQISRMSMPIEPKYPRDAFKLLSPQLTTHRRQRMLLTASQRTDFVRLVVQDVHQPHNISACIRSAEAFGVQSIHVVTLQTKFDTSTVTRGVDSWVHINRHKSIAECVQVLRQEGYRIAAAYPKQDSCVLSELPLDKPVALVFGNEHAGLDAAWLPHIDLPFTIPMAGIVESLNISVSAAISLFETCKRAKEKVPKESYFLSAEQQASLLNEWVCKQFPTYEKQLERLRK